MSNNYLQFSFSIPLRNRSEVRWIRSHYNFLQELSFFDEDEEELSSICEKYGISQEEMKKIEERGWRKWTSVDFEKVIEKDGNKMRVWIYAEENGDVTQVVSFLTAFLADTKRQDTIQFTWSETCSKMREDEFSGGGVVFNASRVEWIDMGAELKRRYQALKENAPLAEEKVSRIVNYSDWFYEHTDSWKEGTLGMELAYLFTAVAKDTTIEVSPGSELLYVLRGENNGDPEHALPDSHLESYLQGTDKNGHQIPLKETPSLRDTQRCENSKTGMHQPVIAGSSYTDPIIGTVIPLRRSACKLTGYVNPNPDPNAPQWDSENDD